MKVYLEQGELALPNDFKLEISHKNPFFSTDGAASAPVTLPPVPSNFEILGHPEEMHKARRTVKDYDASIQTGIFFSKCKLVVDGASRKGGISASIALKESVMYAELQDKKLTELFAGQYPYASSTPWVIYHGNHEPISGHSGNDETRKICFLPVACDQRTRTSGSTEVTEVSVINEPGETSFRNTARNWVIGGENVSMPADYGVVPFLFLWALIEDAFTLCGYTVSDNVFKTVAPLKHIVVLHNTADILVGHTSTIGTYDKWKLVPDITMGDLIGWLRDKFGAVVCAEDGKVSIRLFKDIVAETYDMDLSNYIRDDIHVTHPEPLRLEIETATDIESSAPAADCLEDLVANYRTRAFVDKVSDITGTGLFYVMPLGKYYYRKDSTSTPIMVGTDAFRYARNIKDIEAEEVKTSDNFVPMIEKAGKYMPYVGNSVRRWVENAGDCNENFSQPFMICYAIMAEGHYQGSSYGYDENGNKVQGFPALTPEDLYGSYWEKYQELIINGCPELSCELDLPIEVLLSIDITTPKRLDGSLVLIKSLDFSLSDQGVSSCEAVFQQIAEYTDAVELPDIRIENPQLHWQLVNTCTVEEYGDRKNGVTIDERDGVEDYTLADAPDTIPDRAGVIAMRRSRWLKYTEYGRSRSFLSWEKWSRTSVHRYEEYFISTFNG